jgi:pimeloyl-ACP methyl ester carboxylesterase
VADFVLVHGGLCGAWCWTLFEPELQRKGHRTRALDLPIEDPEATLDDYAAAVVAEMQDLNQPWLVGHSMGGLVVPRVALRKPVAGLIFLCAGFPPTNETEHREDIEARDPGNEAHFIPDGQGRITLSFEGAAHDFFNDCSPDLQQWAFAQFRPQATAPFSDYSPIERYPDVPMHAIVGADDHIVLREKHSALIRRRIGVEPVELPGGHCPFVARPRRLAEVVDAMVSRP